MLLVATVVILAATISGYLTGTIDDLTSAEPLQAAFSADYTRDTAGDGYTLAITHQGGDALDTSAPDLMIEGARSRDTASPDNERAVYTDSKTFESTTGDRLNSGETVRLDRIHFSEVGGDPIDGTDYLDLDGTVIDPSRPGVPQRYRAVRAPEVDRPERLISSRREEPRSTAVPGTVRPPPRPPSGSY